MAGATFKHRPLLPGTPARPSARGKTPTSVSPDGKFLLYHANANGATSAADLWVLPLTPDSPGAPLKPRALLQTPFDESLGQFSPDGKWVAYVSNESGRSEVYGISYPGPGGKRQISTGGGQAPLWRRDGKELFYVTPNGDLMAAAIDAHTGTLEVGKTERLFGGISVRGSYLYAPAADGQRFIVAQTDTATSSPPLTVIQNWPALLKK